MRKARWTLLDSDFHVLLGILLLALAARGAAMVVFRSHLRQDPDHYAVIAANLAQHGCYCLSPGHPTAFRPPLYPLLLAPWSITDRTVGPAVVVLHLAFSAIIVTGVYVLGHGWSDRRGAALAALVVALDPLLIHQSTLLMTETSATALAVIALLAWMRWESNRTALNVGHAAIALGLAALCRPTFWVWVPWIVAGLLLVPSRNWRGGLIQSALLIAVLLVVVSPWTLRNWLVLQRPIMTTTHGGYTLWLANNDGFYDWLSGPRQRPWTSEALDEQQKTIFAEVGFDEVAADRRYQQLALDTIQRRPASFLRACLWRLAKLWHPLPEQLSPQEGRLHQVLRWATAAWYSALFASTLYGLSRLRSLPFHRWWPALSLCLAFTLLHAFYWSNIRMRAPLMPSVALVASLAFLSSSRRDGEAGADEFRRAA